MMMLCSGIMVTGLFKNLLTHHNKGESLSEWQVVKISGDAN